MINREILRSSERIRRKKVLRVFSFLSLFLAIVFALTSYVFHMDILYIKQIYVLGNKQVREEEIVKAVKQVLDGSYFGLYPKSNRLIYPAEEIVLLVTRRIPWVSSVSLSGGVGSIFVEVKEREPRYLRCDDLLKPALDRVCFYLDALGFAFDRAPNFSSHVYLEFYGGVKKGGYVGRSVLPTQILQAVLEVKNRVESIVNSGPLVLGKIYGIYIQGNGDYDLLLIGGRREWAVTFNLTDVVKDGEIQRIEKKFRAIVSSPFFIKEFESSNKQLQYIDLRFGKKVFYKFD